MIITGEALWQDTYAKMRETFVGAVLTDNSSILIAPGAVREGDALVVRFGVNSMNAKGRERTRRRGCHGSKLLFERKFAKSRVVGF